MRVSGFPILTICLSTIAGCSISAPPPPIDMGRLEQVTQEVTLVGDTQEHEIMGLPPSLKGGLVDSELEVTIRQPQHALFGRMVLADIIRRHPGDLIIHLGDVIDVSCRSELSRIDKVFALAGENWAVAPGNHDGLAMGVFNFSSDDWKMVYGGRAWDYECRVPQNGRVDTAKNLKGYFASVDTFLHWYLDRKHVLADEGAAIAVPGPETPLPHDGMSDSEAKQRCHAAPGQLIRWPRPDGLPTNAQGSPFLKEVVGRIEHWSPCNGTTASRSYILQKVALPSAPNSADLKTSMVLLDTTQTGRRFDGFGLGLFADSAWTATAGENPGALGYVMDDQIRALEDIVEAQGSDEILIFGGHHPWDSLSHDTRSKLQAVLAKVQNPLVYISAHTHTGYWRNHRAGQRSLMELNVSSLADWPVAFRRMTIHATPDRSLLRIEAALNGNRLFGKPPESQPSDSKQLVADWRSYCMGKGADFDEIRLQHSKIVDAHRRARQDWRMFIDAMIPDVVRGVTPDDWDNYLDKLNDLEYGAQAIALAGDLNPDFRANLVSSMQDSLAACADASTDLRSCVAAYWMQKRKFLEAHGVVQTYFNQIAAFVSEAQNTVDGVLLDDHARPYLACTAIAAAMTDQSIQSNRNASNLQIENSYYDDSRLAQ